ncbi:MAG: hypothetical protein NT164_06065 [Verrucomicrobiae bacterium]|nr:hypothetical protein [Verrucomicrobiae bacterium]
MKNYNRFPSATPRRASAHGVDGIFAWTIFIFLLMGFALFCWIGSFYVFGHPEKSVNYHLLMRLHKLDEPQRFELTEAPRGEFLKPKQLLERFGPLGQRETRRLNDRLLSNFLRNYHQTHDLTPYVTETYRVLAAFPLTKKNFFYPGMCALLQSVDQPEILLEQVFPAVNSKLISKIDRASEVKGISDAQTRSIHEILTGTNSGAAQPVAPAVEFEKMSNDLNPLEQALTPGQEIKFEKPLDLSAILHVEKLPDGHLKLTTISLLYGSYGPTSSGPVLFSLAPPAHLNIEGGLPLLPPKDLISAETQHADYRTKMGFSRQEGTQQTVQPNSAFILQIISNKLAASAKKSFLKNISRAAKAVPVTAPKVARALPLNTPAVLPATPVALPVAPAKQVAPLPTATPLSSTTPLEAEAAPALAAANQSSLPPPTSFAPAPGTPMAITERGPLPDSNNPLWPTYDPGKMPRGRFVAAPQLRDLAEQGLAGERLYLQGDFAVTASGQDRSVLRYQSNNSSLTPDGITKMRIIVAYPAGAVPPAEGTSVARNQDHPFMITDVKKGNDGTVNVYVREILK